MLIIIQQYRTPVSYTHLDVYKRQDEYYDLIEVYKGLDRYDQELVWLMIQNIRKNAEKRKRDRDDD